MPQLFPMILGFVITFCIVTFIFVFFKLHFIYNDPKLTKEEKSKKVKEFFKEYFTW